MNKRKEIKKVSQKTINSFKEICKYIGVIALIPVVLISLDILLISLMEILKINYFMMLIISIFVIIQTFVFVIKIGFKCFNEESYLNKIFSILFGFSSYLSLLFQLAIVFLIYYVSVDSNIIPNHIFSCTDIELELSSESFFSFIRLILNYIFPNFYKYPSVEGIAVDVQFFLGKFIDLFILAFIVERLKKKI